MGWTGHLSLYKNTPQFWNLQFRVEFFNVLNHANFDTSNPVLFNGNVPSATAGVITETSNRERQIQFALKLLF